jgi:polar amino acid transport system substrate-binding protein
MPRHTLCCAAPAALLLLSLPAPAQPTCPPRPIVVGLYEFGYYYHAGTGLDKDLAEQLAKRSGCAFEFRVLPRRAIWQGMQSGAIDMTFSAAAPPERLTFAWAEPYLWVRYMVILRKDAGARIRSTADFVATPNLRLGLGRGHVVGYPYEDFVSQLRNIGRVEDVDDIDRMYAMFKAGRFQAVIASPLVYSSYLKDPALASAVRIEDWSPSRQKSPVHMLISKKGFSQDEARRWAEVMKGISTDGTMMRLLTRYLAPDAAAKLLTP